MPASDWLGQHKASEKCTVVPVGWETLPWSIDRSIADEWVAKSIMGGCIFTSKPAPRCCRCWSTCRRCGRSRPDGCRRRTASRPQEWSLLQRRKKERESNKISRKRRSLKPKGHRRKVEKCKGAGGAGRKSHRLLAHLLGKVILTCVELKTDELLYLFLARHSYSPESVVLVLKMISSDRFLRKGKDRSDCGVDNENVLKWSWDAVMFNTHFRCTWAYLVAFRLISRLSLNQATFGGGWPPTLHTSRTRLPSTRVTFGVMKWIAGRVPDRWKTERKKKKKSI